MTNDELDDLIEAWHTGDTGVTIWEFLGWPKEKYAAWLQGYGDWHEPCPEDWCNDTHRWARWPEEDGSLGWVIGHTTVIPAEAFAKLQEALRE